MKEVKFRAWDKELSKKMCEIIEREFKKAFTENAIETLEALKTNIKPSFAVEYDKIIIMDHEKIRKKVPFHTERGKTIFYNPKNKKVEELLMSQYRENLKED